MECPHCNQVVRMIKTDKGSDIQVDLKSVRIWTQSKSGSSTYEFKVGYVGHNNTCPKHRGKK